MAQTRETGWHFHCPDCGYGDANFGHLVTAADIHCIVCLEEDGREVRLRRWLPVDETDAGAADQALLRGALAVP